MSNFDNPLIAIFTVIWVIESAALTVAARFWLLATRYTPKGGAE
jgi:hypothetical protein